MANGSGGDKFKIKVIEPSLKKKSKVSNIESELPEQYLRLYPNPTRNMLKISYLSATKEQVIIKITNVLGKEIFHRIESPALGQNYSQIDVSNFTPAIYFVTINQKDACITKKIVLKE